MISKIKILLTTGKIIKWIIDKCKASTKARKHESKSAAALMYQKIPRLLLLICSVNMMGCASPAPLPTTTTLSCKQAPPKLTWIRTDAGSIKTLTGISETKEGGVYLPPKSLGLLVNYIHDIRDCRAK